MEKDMFKSKIAAKLAAYFALAVLVFAFVMAFSFGHFFRENFIERQQRGLAYRAASVAAIMGDNLERSRLREAREAREKNAGETAAGTENKSGSGTEAPAVSGQSAKAGPAAGSKAVNPGSLLRSRRLIAYVNIITADDVWVANKNGDIAMRTHIKEGDLRPGPRGTSQRTPGTGHPSCF